MTNHLKTACLSAFFPTPPQAALLFLRTSFSQDFFKISDDAP